MGLRKKILLYSHDSYGLGHLRRSQTIAHALIDFMPECSVLIVSGSPVVGQFEWKHGVDFMRVPGITKLHNGDYESHHLNIDIQELIKLRGALIAQTIDTFEPDLIIVDKEPLGLRGELTEALTKAKEKNIKVVLGLRDVLDDITSLNIEWQRKNIYPQLDRFYNEIWVYGVESMGSPLQGLPISKEVESKIVFTGFLNRLGNSASFSTQKGLKKIDHDKDFLLGMVGGGGDGDELIEALMSTYEHGDEKLLPIALILGPFMVKDAKKYFLERAKKLKKVEVLFFSSHIECLLHKAKGIISMGGYNSFCEILSFDKPSLIYPRIVPRREQYIRAERAQKEGLIGILSEEDLKDLDALKAKLIDLPFGQKPSEKRNLDLLLGGLPWISNRVRGLLT